MKILTHRIFFYGLTFIWIIITRLIYVFSFAQTLVGSRFRGCWPHRQYARIPLPPTSRSCEFEKVKLLRDLYKIVNRSLLGGNWQVGELVAIFQMLGNTICSVHLERLVVAGRNLYSTIKTSWHISLTQPGICWESNCEMQEGSLLMPPFKGKSTVREYIHKHFLLWSQIQTLLVLLDQELPTYVPT